MENYPLLMTEEYWATTHFSVARYYGGIKIDGRDYIIVDKHGRDLWECTEAAEREGRQMAIEAGEPADLILKTLQPAYRKLGRDEIIRRIKEGATEQQLRDSVKRKRKKTNDEKTLF